MDVKALPSDNMTLKELGFDSLLQIELEAQLLSAFPNVDFSSLSDCGTIRDIENLSSGQQILGTPPSLVSEMATSDASSNDDLPDIQQLTRAVIAETCSGDVNNITSSSELSALGIDSLMVFELESSLSKIGEHVNISTAELTECLTVGDVEKLVSKDWRLLKRTEKRSAASPISVTDIIPSFDSTGPTAISTSIASHSSLPSIETLLSPDTIEKVTRMLKLEQQPEVIQSFPSLLSRPHGNPPAPLFLIHDGSGVCTHYRRLGSLDRPVYALHDPKFLDPLASWAKMSDMVDEYHRIITSATKGPYILGGWSFGGVVAFEVAQRLKRLGHAVVGTILIDSPPPINHQPLSSRLIDAVVQQDRLPGTQAGKAIQALILRSFAACARLIGGFSPRAVDELSVPNIYLLRSREGWRYPTDPDLITDVWVQDRSDPRTGVEDWGKVSRSKVRWEDIPGDHFCVFDRANVDAVTIAVKRAILELEALFSRASSTD